MLMLEQLQLLQDSIICLERKNVFWSGETSQGNERTNKRTLNKQWDWGNWRHTLTPRRITTETRVANDNSIWHGVNRCLLGRVHMPCVNRIQLEFQGGVHVPCIHRMPGGLGSLIVGCWFNRCGVDCSSAITSHCLLIQSSALGLILVHGLNHAQ